VCEQPSTFVVPRGIDVVAADAPIEWPALTCIPEPALELVGAHDALDRERHGFDLWQGGADVRPDFNWDKKPVRVMGYR